jgi:DNA-binding MarR family transcriptional regulator/nicotinamide riboside kinase
MERKTISVAVVTFDSALEVLNHYVFEKQGRYLSRVEVFIVQGIWEGIDYGEIAHRSTYTINYIQRTVAPKLWPMLSNVIGNGHRIGKKNFRPHLEQLTRKYYAQLKDVEDDLNDEDTGLIGEIEVGVKLSRVLGDLPPSTVDFWGRKSEISYLKEAITKLRCVAVTGNAGIGKTALIAKLVSELSIKSPPLFEELIWKSISHAPLIQDLVTDLVEIIQPDEPLPEYIQGKISVLLKQLQNRRILVVLDADDLSNALFQKLSLDERLEYEIFFRRLVEERHKSLLLITTRILPRDLEALIKGKRSIQAIKLTGLDLESARQLLYSYGLIDKEKCHELIETYRGNPRELQEIAKRTDHYFGSIGTFFRFKTTLVSDSLQSELDQKFGSQKMSEVQLQIMVFLASQSEGMRFEQILMHLNQKMEVSPSELVKALEELEKEYLIEVGRQLMTQKICITLSPTTRKYILNDPNLAQRSA